METKLNKANLYALYVTENKYDFYFVKYFWKNEDAFYFGESAYKYLNRDIKGYKIQEHLIATTRPFSDLTILEYPIENYIVINEFQ